MTPDLHDCLRASVPRPAGSTPESSTPALEKSSGAALDTWLVVTVAAPRPCHRAGLRESVDGPDLGRITRTREIQTTALPPRGPGCDNGWAVGLVRSAAACAVLQVPSGSAARPAFQRGDLGTVPQQHREVSSEAVVHSRVPPGNATGALWQERRFGFTSGERTASCERHTAWSENAAAACPTETASPALLEKQPAARRAPGMEKGMPWLLLAAAGIVLSGLMVVIG
jgi:hypothetical protein